MGVWIETLITALLFLVTMSHPSWVCGLKQTLLKSQISTIVVTPFVGVWIETICPIRAYRLTIVTPFVGVWIETFVLSV